MKKILTMLVVIAIVFCCFCTSALATGDNNSFSNQSQELIISDDLIDQLDMIFLGYGAVYDVNNRDITEDFILRNIHYYEQGDYQTILRVCLEEKISELVSTFNMTSDNQILGTRSVETVPYSQSRTKLITNNNSPYNGKTWYITVTVSGNMTVGYAYPNIIVIQSVTNPSFNFSFSSQGSGFTGSVNSVSYTAPVISSSGTSFSFNATVSHNMVGPGLTLLDPVTLGPFTNTFSFQISA